MSHLEFSPEPGSRWGLLGGAFDPPHNAHLALAKSALAHGRVDGVSFLVSAVPPHKNQPQASFADRLAMLELHVAGTAGLVISDIEKEVEEPGYTVRVVEELIRRYPQVEFSLIIGSDNVAILEQWNEVERLLQLVTLIIAQRTGLEAEIPEKWRSRIRTVPLDPYTVSSAELRKKISDGESIAGLTSSAVIDYIQTHRLYR
jgi:nicotinate-nucleotide adenylyltransferase